MLLNNSNMRRGLAPLEFVLSLPILLLLFGVIISTAYINLGKTQVILHAKNEAWKKRDNPGSDDIQLVVNQEATTAILKGPGQVRPGSSQVNKTESVRVIPVFNFATTSASAKHVVLGGAWDYKNISFPGDNDKLVFDRRVLALWRAPLDQQYFGVMNTIDQQLGTFNGLSNVDQLMNLGDPGSSGMPDLGKLAQLGQSVAGPVEDALKAVQKLEDALSSLTDALEDPLDFLTGGSVTALADATIAVGNVVSSATQLANLRDLPEIFNQAENMIGSGNLDLENVIGQSFSDNPLSLLSSLPELTDALGHIDEMPGGLPEFFGYFHELIFGKEY